MGDSEVDLKKTPNSVVWGLLELLLQHCLEELMADSHYLRERGELRLIFPTQEPLMDRLLMPSL